MASLESNLDSNSSDTHQEGSQRKRRRIGDEARKDQNSLTPIPWRSETEQQIYSSKLVQALRHVLRWNPSAATLRV